MSILPAFDSGNVRAWPVMRRITREREREGKCEVCEVDECCVRRERINTEEKMTF